MSTYIYQIPIGIIYSSSLHDTGIFIPNNERISSLVVSPWRIRHESLREIGSQYHSECKIIDSNNN